MSDFPGDHGEPLSLCLADLPPESFFRRFAELNHLGHISCFLFPSGSLFNDPGYWWGDRHKRPVPHEGVDISLMRGFDCTSSRVAALMLVPALLSGKMVHFHRDFLGETIYIQHPEMRHKGTVLHSLYGHLQPGSAPPHPFVLKKGQELGAINSPPESRAVPAHLHISCAWIEEDLPLTGLNWDSLAANSGAVFIDPLPFLLH